MSALDDLLKKHRAKLIAGEEETFASILRVYQELQRELRQQYVEIQKTITDAAASGVEISRAWVGRSERVSVLLSQVDQQIVRFGGQVTSFVSSAQAEAMITAAQQTSETLRILASDADSGVRIPLGGLLPTTAIENAVGMMGNGSPMIAYFEKTFAPAVAEALKKEIINGVATGTDFRTIANRLMKAGDITRVRALAMARTEVNRVRRATTLQTYREQPENISGWQWVASISPRTCIACLMMDGTIHSLDEEFPQHINCRCTMIPVIIGVSMPPRLTGAEWFVKASQDIQEEILGKDAFDAWDRGEVTLQQFVGWATSKEFGKRVYTRPLSAILAGQH